jgi:hypothetical protein
MRRARILSFVALAWLIKTTSPVVAEESKCGPAPSFRATAGAGSAEKSQLQAQADSLSTLVGKAEFAGRVKATRNSLYQSFDNAIAAQRAAYLGYLFCLNIMKNDNTLNTLDKLAALRLFRNQVDNENQTREVSETLDVLSIVDTGYDYLYSMNSERNGFGLYTYALLAPGNPDRTYTFISAITNFTSSTSAFGDDVSKVNAIYIPTVKQSDASGSEDKYSFELSRRIILSICRISSAEIIRICKGSLSEGPYLFTYASPIGKTKQLIPPILFLDLSKVHQQAFATFLDVYKQQIKRNDITDGEKLNSLAIRILSLTLTAKDWMSPIEHAVADIVHLVSKEDTDARAK